ncbi:hypothetical protein KKB11_02450 [Candidatus Micrarchaeota archaeon]|nr:hypothetical protein [Candidatus Micrarchaeota archaeon]
MIGVDLGLSSFKAIQIENRKIKRKKRIFLSEKNTEKQIKEFFSDSFFSEKKIALTGAFSGKAIEMQKKEKKSGKEKKFIQVNEIDSIASGSAFLSKEKNFLAVSAGTGTAFVSVKGKKIIHAGGTAIGGKTILGLSTLILKEKEFKKIEGNALKGNSDKVDLMLKDFYPKGIGLLKNNVCVAHFGKISSRKKEDLNAGIFNLVSQGISINALFAAKAFKHKKIVFSGSLAESKIFRKTFIECSKVFNLAEPVFLKEGAFASALGAAMIAEKKGD